MGRWVGAWVSLVVRGAPPSSTPFITFKQTEQAFLPPSLPFLSSGRTPIQHALHHNRTYVADYLHQVQQQRSGGVGMCLFRGGIVLGVCEGVELCGCCLCLCPCPCSCLDLGLNVWLGAHYAPLCLAPPRPPPFSRSAQKLNGDATRHV